jgi:hypothetical protein
MKISAVTAKLGLGFVLFGSLPLLAAGGQVAVVQLKVSVFNASPISSSTIERAEGEAGRVLHDAGVDVIWLNCPQAISQSASLDLCSEASFPLHLHLRIIRDSHGLKVSTVGISFSTEDGRGCYADLFYEPIRQLEEETHVSPSVILGHAMAHELGHLLLGTSSHSPSGLMRAHWTRDDLLDATKGNLRFSQEQRLKLRSRLTASEDVENENRNDGAELRRVETRHHL